MNTIQVYGPGCAKCASLAEVTKQAVQELQWDVPVKKVTDPMLFAVAGVLVTPALVMNGKVLLSGKVPSVEAVKGLLQEADGACRQGGCCGSREEKAESSGGCACSGGCDRKEPAESAGGCGCGEGGCCGGGKPGCGGWKKAVVWIAAVLVLLAVVKLVNRSGKESAGADAVAVPVMQEGVEAVYYQYGARCPTCVKMEGWIKEALDGSFADALKDGRLVFRSIPADAATVRHYGMTTKSLIVSSRKQGKEADWKNLERIWDLNGDEAAFKEYVVQEVRKQVDGVK